MRAILLSLVISCSPAFAKKNADPAGPSVKLDMITNAWDLSKEQRDEIILLYDQSVSDAKRIQGEMGKVKGALFKQILEDKRDEAKIKELKSRLQQLANELADSMIQSLEKVTVVVKNSKLDRHYFYRAFLREHRRTMPGFSD